MWKKREDLAEEAYLKQRFAYVAEQTDLLIEAIKSPRTKVSLSKKDAERSELFSRAINVLKGAAALPSDEKRKIGEEVLEVVERHGGKKFLQLPYKEKASVFDSLEKEFSSEKMKALTAKIDGLDELLSGVFALNKEVEAMSLDNSQKSRTTSAYLIKRKIVAYFNKEILPYLSLMKNDKPAVYTAFADDIFAAVEKANQTAKKK